MAIQPRSPVIEAEYLILTISDLSRGGSGVARDPGGRVIFVPFTAPGDEVRVKILDTEKRYAQAELVEMIKPSSLRVQPKCPVFMKCGGCQWQHLPYELQWKTKVSGVKHVLSRYKVEFSEIFKELPAERIWEYRNRIQLRGFQEQMGFFAPGSHDLISISRCDISRPEINASLSEIRRTGLSKTKPYKVEVEVLESGEVTHSWNSPHAAAGFRQVHDEQNEKLKSWVREHISPNREVYDLFGGRGNLSIQLAAQGMKVQCVDLSSPQERPPGTPSSLEFHCSSVLPWLMKQVRSHKDSFQKSAVLDPPREGLGENFAEIANSLEALGVDEVLAVGCDADSWGRDVSRFCRRGWKLTHVAALDLFPQTPHVESLAVLRR